MESLNNLFKAADIGRWIKSFRRQMHIFKPDPGAVTWSGNSMKEKEMINQEKVSGCRRDREIPGIKGLLFWFLIFLHITLNALLITVSPVFALDTTSPVGSNDFRVVPATGQSTSVVSLN